MTNIADNVLKQSTKEKRLTIDFQKIIDGEYLTEDLLTIYQWIIRLGRDCDKQVGWYRYGLHQSFHGYSHNNEARTASPLGSDWKNVIYNGFVRILCRTKHHSSVQQFLTDNRIKVGKKRIYKFMVDEQQTLYNKIRYTTASSIINYITSAYKGLELKKALFQPDFPDRLHPRIIDNVQFGTNGLHWYAWFTYSFNCFNYEPGWKYTIAQNENENILSFFNRAATEIDNLLVPANNCDNCPMWTGMNKGDYLRHGLRGTCWKNDICEKPDVVKYRWWSDNVGIHDNATHHSIVFPYYTNR